MDGGTFDDVVEQEPAVAGELFGDRLDLARQFVRALVEHGEERGLVGPQEVPRIWTRHVLNCAIAAPLFPTGGRVGDVGSGAGLPGVVLAIARPDVTWELIEPMERRVSWLDEQVSALGLENVTVHRARADEVAVEGMLDAVTARAVSAMRTLIPWTAPLVRDGGELILLKGRSVDAEIDAAQKVLRKHRVTDVRVEVLGEGVLDETTRVVRAVVRAS
ncbi:16S rRNA (guanine(527)-N(7))-methyltransferase RsmG [Microbacterium sp.]|uniref:16S rRNA (guanine(527)-N(7))-methyltransferase RsmG n=1 Tax=Microbacterium sp. TaxID=51671 RepID=UPI003F99C493